MTELQMVTEAMGYKGTGDCYVHIESKNGSGHYVATGDGNALIKTACVIAERAAKNYGCSFEEALDLMRKAKERGSVSKWLK